MKLKEMFTLRLVAILSVNFLLLAYLLYLKEYVAVGLYVIFVALAHFLPSSKTKREVARAFDKL